MGWKLGVGAAERIGQHPAVGHLTSATQVATGRTYRPVKPLRLKAHAEVVVELGRDVDPGAEVAAVRDMIAGFGAALEIVVLGHPEPADAIVAKNVFHRAFALGDIRGELPERTTGALIVNGAPKARATVPDLPPRVLAAAQVVARVGEKLLAGDRIITGAVVQVDVSVGDLVVAEFGPLGTATLHLAEWE